MTDQEIMDTLNEIGNYFGNCAHNTAPNSKVYRKFYRWFSALEAARLRIKGPGAQMPPEEQDTENGLAEIVGYGADGMRLP